MIEVIDAERCTECDICVRVCPTNVFDAVPGGIPVIARHSDCQTCFQCEAWCPADAIFVSPSRTPEPAGSPLRDAAHLAENDLLGLYRERIGWRRGRDTTAPTSPPPSGDDYHRWATPPANDPLTSTTTTTSSRSTP